MKKVIIIVMFVVVICGTVFAQANMRNRVVGTWTDGGGSEWVFNVNGTISGGGDARFGGGCARWGLAEPRIALVCNAGTLTFDLSMAADGKTMILHGGAGLGVLLTKK